VRKRLNGTNEPKPRICSKGILIRNISTYSPMINIGKQGFTNCKMGTKQLPGTKSLKNIYQFYYRSLFGPPQENNFRLDETRKDDIPQVTDKENENLIQPFTESKIKITIFSNGT
jgi:hypothetical protein